MLRSFHALHLCLQNACCDQKVSTMRLSGKYEAPENCSLTYYANLNGDNPEINLIGSIPSKELKIKQLG